MKTPKRIVVLGSTGSIGTQTLEVASHLGRSFDVVGLSAFLSSEMGRLCEQVREFKPRAVAVQDEKQARLIRGQTGLKRVWSGEEGLVRLAGIEPCDIVVNGISGAAGLAPTLAAIKAGKRLALANKESLVVAGELVMPLVRKHKAEIIPVDSEHSAIFQCLKNEPVRGVKRLILTASGGPFRRVAGHRLRHMTPAHALKHPTWSMGRKITIDSATLMNKGLEIIEAHWLFGLEGGKIDVLIHPQSIIHSMVEFVDGAILAQASLPDMRLPIQYALTYPERMPSPVGTCDLAGIKRLTFHPPNPRKFPCLRLAYEVLRTGGTLPAVLNAANEVAVYAFLEERIGFHEIPRVIARTLRKHRVVAHPGLEDILEADRWARATALSP
jgi:1-deoxy-D-xylulose-5-phosphate reductoisomerase